MSERKRPRQPEPSRPVDATAMKAFAHPLRMAMYDYLNDHGAATATMLARHTGESTGQTSYHLRQLERHGFVTEDVGRGTGRERWWRAVGFRMRGIELARDSATRPAVASMLRNQVNHQAATLADWFARSEQEEPRWAEISTNNRFTLQLTPQEAAEMGRRVVEVMQDYVEVSREREEQGKPGPEEVRRIRVYLDVIPLPLVED